MPLPVIAGALLAAGAGQAMGMLNDRRQIKMNEKLIEQQTAAGMEMGRFNQKLALDMWDKTNYEAQRKHLEKAGLNPALMYGTAGSGGTTQGGRADMPSSSTAPTGGGELGMGMQAGLQAQMMQAQIEATKAQTENTKADTAVKLEQPGVMETGRQLTQQQTLNAVTQGIVLDLEKEIKNIEKYKADNTASDIIQQINYEMQRAEGEAKQAQTEGKLKEETYNEALQQIRQTTIEQQVRIASGKMSIQADEAKIKQISAEITKTYADNQREWEKLSYEDRKIRIQQKANEIAKQMVDYNTGGEAQTERWSKIIMGILGGIPRR